MDRCKCCGRRMRLIDKERQIAGTFTSVLEHTLELEEKIEWFNKRCHWYQEEIERIIIEYQTEITRLRKELEEIKKRTKGRLSQYEIHTIATEALKEGETSNPWEKMCYTNCVNLCTFNVSCTPNEQIVKEGEDGT